MIDSFKTQLGRFRVLAFAEGVSFLLILFITMPLKYLMDMPGPNKIIGMAHGIPFCPLRFSRDPDQDRPGMEHP